MHNQPTKFNIFLGKGALPPCNPKNLIYIKILTEKGLNCAFIVPSNIHSLMKRMAAPLQPPETIYFCKLRPKRVCPLATPKSCIRIYLKRKGTEIVHLWFPKIHILLKKRAAPLRPPEIIYFCNLDQKGPEIMHIYLAKYKIFLRKGVLPPCNPCQVASSLNPCERPAQACGLLALLAVVWVPQCWKSSKSMSQGSYGSIIIFFFSLLFFLSNKSPYFSHHNPKISASNSLYWKVQLKMS